MTERAAGESFIGELRHLLHHLYDPGELAKSPLIELLVLDRQSNPAAALRRALLQAVQTLKPEAVIPPHSNAWRLYHVLVWRYVEQSKQNEVAANLAISPRQLRRLERDAVRVLADHLWLRYDLQAKTTTGEWDRATQETAPQRLEAETPDRSQELQWLKESFPTGLIDIPDLVDAAIRTLAPLAEASNTQIAWQRPENLPSVTGQAAALRQVIVGLLSAAIHTCPSGEVEIVAETDHGEVVLFVQTRHCCGPAHVSSDRIDEQLHMARQFSDLLSAQLDLFFDQTPTQPTLARLALPVAELTTVLFIDDNADTLQLLQRYLVGTRYRFVGTHDPERALALAREQRPQAIVLDIMLPGVDGWELLGRLREHPDLRDVPILVCTILPQEQLAVTLGAAGLIRKPVNRTALLAALNHQMGQPESRSTP
jgi:CheY-like chemotaxis protein